MHYVYAIKIDGVNRYIGRTSDLKRRTYSHNYAFKRGEDKYFYNYLREIGFKGKLELSVIIQCKTVVESKRIELFLILLDWLFTKELKNRIPNIR